jgi:hypothetical protein
MYHGRFVPRRFKVIITGPQSFQRAAVFAIDDGSATIKERVRETIEEEG